MKYFYVVFAISCSLLLITNTYAYQYDLVEPIDKPSVENYETKELSFLTFGNQTKVAKAMTKWSGQYNSNFVLSVGDDEGVSSVYDAKWDKVWKNAYKGRLSKIPWYIVAGNHDWYGNITAQIDYSLNYDSRYFFPSTYFVRESYFGPNKTKVAWIHIDTNIFYYDFATREETEHLGLKYNFEKFGWQSLKAIEDKFKWIEDRLNNRAQNGFSLSVGHQPLIGKYAQTFQMGRLRPLFEKYRVAAYFSGHEHVLELETSKIGQSVTYFISGACSKAHGKCEGFDWGMPVGALGFLHTIISKDEMYYEFVESSTLEPKMVYQGKVLPI
ncbi:8567_t:CDS:2 [Funneliformis geosporum]|uniref:12751_t:CDS:1 n=1 Tax=Funneliformis geosporum TaxID=1117311 RepID=A0A9W4WZ28_9GLOM|nr:8567_t:CDS:2 [Funneliformis geosporum]CAI2183045.1 12751_t:CDS:2 [Funneliformis geosporum]